MITVFIQYFFINENISQTQLPASEVALYRACAVLSSLSMEPEVSE